MGIGISAMLAGQLSKLAAAEGSTCMYKHTEIHLYREHTTARPLSLF